MYRINYPKNRYGRNQPHPWMDKDWLYDQYIIQNKSSQEIADEYGCRCNTIQCWLAKYKIKKQIIPRKRIYSKQYQQEDYLIEEHINKHKSITELAKENQVSHDTIVHFLKKYNIKYWTVQNKTKYTQEQENEICRLYNEEKLSAYKIGQMYDTSHSVIIDIVERNGYKARTMQEAQFNYNKKEIPDLYKNADKLRYLYWDCGLNSVELEKILNIDAGCIRDQMHRLGIPTRSNAESKIGQMIGEKHPNWKGGICELNVLLREYFQINLAPIAAKRDNYTCQLCGATHTVLHVHHKKHFSQIVREIINKHPELNIKDNKQELYNIITHDKEFLDIDNLVTYCKDCHLFKIHHYKRHKIISNQASIEEGSETIEKAE